MLSTMYAVLNVISFFCVSASSLSSPRVGLFDQHQHALEHVLEGLENTHLPVTLIHLDSHVDMSVSKFLEASHLHWDSLKQNPKEALALTQHNSWVAASWLLGVVNKLIFVEPPWSTDFGTHSQHRSLIYSAGTVDGKFKVSIHTPGGDQVSHEYWHTLDDGELHPERHMGDLNRMEDRVDLEVEIIPFAELLTTLPELIASDDRNEIWLDIDMSVFATESPSHMEFFQETRIPMRWQQLLAETWKDVSTVTANTKSFGSMWWQQNLHDWHHQCPSLEHVFSSHNDAKEGDTHDTITVPPESIPSVSFVGTEFESSLFATKLYDGTMLTPENNVLQTRTEIIRLLSVFESEIEELFNKHEEVAAAHMLWHSLVSPIHLSSNREIDVMIAAVSCLLDDLTARSKTPAFLTVARSEYTPSHLVPYIECAVLNMLSKAYPTRQLYHNSGFDADVSKCDLGYTFHSIGKELEAKENDSFMTTPVELVIANTSPENLVAHWRSPSGELINEFSVPAFSYDNHNCVSFHGHEWVITTRDGVTIDEKVVNAKEGHTQVWSVTTGQVDDLLRHHGIMRHRAL